ncbi:hypothetical protein ACFWR9_07010 [Streptomyces sp. NPDC058534]|uniref:hypothetical protein n=1 Tax=Streptomyces sp. NPDC058534 TaxID=3346541 RepID=UPI003648A439
MGRGGAPWPGALAAATVVVSLAVAACGNSGGQDAGSGTAREASGSPASASAPPSAPSPAAACVSAVGYWARELLDGGEPYGDYQSMGLSNRQYGILREVVAAARVTERDQGDRAAGELIDRQVRQACEEQYAGGGPSDGPWQ